MSQDYREEANSILDSAKDIVNQTISELKKMKTPLCPPVKEEEEEPEEEENCAVV